MTNQIEIGRGKRGRRAFSLDDVSVVPARRTRDPQDVSLTWRIDAYTFDMPVIGAPMDSVMSPETAIAMGRLGGLGVLNLEGLWTRHEDPRPLLEEIAALEAGPAGTEATRKLQEAYAAPIRPDLITERLAQIREAGVVVAGSLTPQNTQEFYRTVVAAGVDLFVIRGTTVSAEHVSSTQEPLDLKQFIYELDVPVIVGGAAGYTPALHLMRTGAAGVLVGFGGGAAHTSRQTLGIHAPMASAIRPLRRRQRPGSAPPTAPIGRLRPKYQPFSRAFAALREFMTHRDRDRKPIFIEDLHPQSPAIGKRHVQNREISVPFA